MVESINDIVRMHEERHLKVIPNTYDFDPGSKSHLRPTLQAFKMGRVEVDLWL
jgi:hypothetical protein